MFKKRILWCLLFCLSVSFGGTAFPSYAESQSAEDLSYNGVGLIILSPYMIAFPLMFNCYLMSEKPNTPGSVVIGLLPAETAAGPFLVPMTAAAGAGSLIAGFGYMPIEAIKKHTELKKGDVQNIPEKPGQPTANFQIQQNGQTKNVQIPLEVKANPIQLHHLLIRKTEFRQSSRWNL